MSYERRHAPGVPLLEPSDVELVRAMLSLGGVPWGELEDGVQQVRVKLLDAGEEIHNRQAWLSVVASRVAVDWHRRRARDESLGERLAARWTDRPPPDQTEDARVLALTVAEGMQGLPPVQRQVLALRYYADLPVREIARRLRVPEGTVKSRLHTAVAALGRRLRDMEVI
ncbi:sigma-70 family RNA polymerase sigma factor [Streptomyces sp. SID4985]|uniref:RNA polymerase sigma factor n=1 Tax=Streptomyces sp. SID4985 TaxID=2690292 RepID=UPI001368ACAC|nr:sigma-70 family RNA polymerase sigma factor [Streptomyces sp. SID4985]MYQ46292.1 sigma-70 family RNA polymerase sigma factor [Streptomyces sp. SID4985]